MVKGMANALRGEVPKSNVNFFSNIPERAGLLQLMNV